MQKILYVEDSADVRDAVIELLVTPERSFIGCDSLAAARQVLAREAIDLVITDVNLPDGSGMAFVDDAAQGRLSCAVIVCTGHDLSAMTVPPGARVGYVRKPFEPEGLEAEVDRVLAGA